MPIDKIDPSFSVNSSNPVSFKTISPQKNDTSISSQTRYNPLEIAAFTALATLGKNQNLGVLEKSAPHRYTLLKDSESIPLKNSGSIPLKDLPIDLIKKLMKSFFEEANNPLQLEKERAEKRERFLNQLYAEFSSAFQQNLKRIRE